MPVGPTRQTPVQGDGELFPTPPGATVPLRPLDPSAPLRAGRLRAGSLTPGLVTKELTTESKSC